MFSIKKLSLFFLFLLYVLHSSNSQEVVLTPKQWQKLQIISIKLAKESMGLSMMLLESEKKLVEALNSIELQELTLKLQTKQLSTLKEKLKTSKQSVMNSQNSLLKLKNKSKASDTMITIISTIAGISIITNVVLFLLIK